VAKGLATTSRGPPVSITEKTSCYDSLGRKTRAGMTLALVGLGSFGPYSTTYGYLNNNAVATVQTPDGDLATYGFDALGRQSALTTTGTGPVMSGVTYDSAGRRDTITFGNGLASRNEYRIAGSPVADQRLKRIYTPGATVLDFAYDYDPAGNIKSIVDQLSGVPETFNYDRLNRLTSHSSSAQLLRGYVYDSIGNRRTSSVAVGASVSTSYSAFGSAYGGVAGPHALRCVVQSLGGNIELAGAHKPDQPIPQVFAIYQHEDYEHDHNYPSKQRIDQSAH